MSPSIRATQNDKPFSEKDRLAVRLAFPIRRSLVLNCGFDDLAILWRDNRGHVGAVREIGANPTVVLQDACCTVFPKLGNKVVTAGRIGTNDYDSQSSILGEEKAKPGRLRRSAYLLSQVVRSSSGLPRRDRPVVRNPSRWYIETSDGCDRSELVPGRASSCAVE